MCGGGFGSFTQPPQRDLSEIRQLVLGFVHQHGARNLELLAQALDRGIGLLLKLIARLLLQAGRDLLQLVRYLLRSLLLETLQGFLQLPLEAIQQRAGLALQPFQSRSCQFRQPLLIVARAGFKTRLRLLAGRLQFGYSLLRGATNGSHGHFGGSGDSCSLFLGALGELLAAFLDGGCGFLADRSQ